VAASTGGRRSPGRALARSRPAQDRSDNPRSTGSRHRGVAPGGRPGADHRRGQGRGAGARLCGAG
jgi:hypothetical protein